METKTLSNMFLQEFEAEIPATLKCLERIPESLYTWKPHEKSMNMGYLTLLVAEIPKWISYAIEKSEIDFATFLHAQPKTTGEMTKHFDENIEGARKALQNVTDEELTEPFYLKRNSVNLFSEPKKKTISSTINHWVHHRGQLTVYMRLNNILVPSIYGPSADERTF
jgi:uncharacterized damage-inducible protein DinB